MAEYVNMDILCFQFYQVYDMLQFFQYVCYVEYDKDVVDIFLDFIKDFFDQDLYFFFWEMDEVLVYFKDGKIVVYFVVGEVMKKGGELGVIGVFYDMEVGGF